MSVDTEAVCKILGGNTKYECTVALTDLTEATSHSHFITGNRIVGNMVSGWSVRTVVEQSGCTWGTIVELEKCVGRVSKLHRS